MTAAKKPAPRKTTRRPAAPPAPQLLDAALLRDALELGPTGVTAANSKQVPLTLPLDLIERADGLAERLGIGRTTLLRIAIRREVARLEKRLVSNR